MAEFKLASAIYNYYNRVAHPFKQNQRYQEIFKPVRGLVFFSIVFTVIKFIATLLMGGEIFLPAVSEIVYNMFRQLLGGCRLFFDETITPILQYKWYNFTRIEFK